MIVARFYFNKPGEITGFILEGHGELEYNGKKIIKGNDILCAGVSSLVQGILIGLEYVALVSPKIIKKESGLLECIINNSTDEKAIVLLKTLLLSLKDIEKQYPDNLKIEQITEI